MYRNRRLGDFLKELHLTEGRCTGFPKIRRAMKHNGSPAVVYETDKDRLYFMATIKIHPEALGTAKQISSGVGGEIREKTRVEIIKIMKENPRVTVGDIAKATGLTIKGVEWNIKDLKQKGLIKRIGPNKGGHWEVVKG